MRLAIAPVLVLAGTMGALSPQALEPEYRSKPKVFASADIAAESYLQQMPEGLKRYAALRLSAEAHRANATARVTKLSTMSSDVGLGKFLHGLLNDRDPIRVPILLEAVTVDNKKLWAVVVAWEFEGSNGPPTFEIGHIAAYIVDAETGNQLAYRACG